MNKPAPGDQQFPEQGMTFVEFVQSVIPGVSDAEADHLLWELTPFPMVSGRDDLLPRLEAIRNELATGATLAQFTDRAHEQLEVARLRRESGSTPEELPSNPQRFDASLQLQDERRPTLVDRRTFRSSTARQIETFQALESWEGAVTDIFDSYFVCRVLSDDSDQEEEAEIPIDDVSPVDLPLLRVGAYFYWSIGYGQSSSGQRTRQSILRFRRVSNKSRSTARLQAERVAEIGTGAPRRELHTGCPTDPGR